MGGAAPAFAADMDSWEVADSGNNATGGTTENGDGPGDVILSMVTAVFAQIKIFCAALLVLCAVVYALVSVFSSRPEIWRGKIVYVAIILVCLLCLGIILTFIEEKVGSGSYSLFQGIDVNGDGSTDTE
jgi:flagellar biosynthesis protein FliQ